MAVNREVPPQLSGQGANLSQRGTPVGGSHMPKISVKLAGDGTHIVVQDHDPIAGGMSLDEVANFVTFLPASE
jgi:hypothetical protein